MADEVPVDPPAFLAAPPSATPPSVSVPAAPTRGTPWLANLGWSFAALGLAIAAYAERYEVDHGEALTFGPLQGFLVGLVLAVLGIVLAIVFLLKPRPAEATPDALGWVERGHEAHARLRSLRIFGFVGIGFLLLGLLFVALVYRSDASADPPTPDLDLLGIVQPFDRWAVMSIAIAFVGFALWLVLGLIEATTRRYLEAATAAAATAAGPGVNAFASAQGVSDAEVLALLQRLDTLMEQLPDAVVGEFAKTPEAETYLKVLGKKAQTPKRP